MNNLNSIILEGNLTADPVLAQLPNGTSVLHFSIGVNRTYKREDEKVKDVSFFSVETFGKLAESCNTYLSKGRGVRVIGRLKQNRWIDPDGIKHEKILVNAEHIELPFFV